MPSHSGDPPPHLPPSPSPSKPPSRDTHPTSPLPIPFPFSVGWGAGAMARAWAMARAKARARARSGRSLECWCCGAGVRCGRGAPPLLSLPIPSHPLASRPSLSPHVHPTTFPSITSHHISSHPFQYSSICFHITYNPFMFHSLQTFNSITPSPHIQSVVFGLGFWAGWWVGGWSG